jgi:hypothetical protein
LGPENPLPPLVSPKSDNTVFQNDASVPESDRLNPLPQFPGCLPYPLQDQYDRNRRPRDFRVAVLENDVLRATFLLERGGRLWSLRHKPTGRELLYTNPIFQPCNLAIRNAWFSGGVEWNIGLIGHAAHTCEPVFAARLAGNGGTPVLRLYEWERVFGIPWQIDCYLPDGSSFLFARVRFRNPHARPVPAYWWSNIAVPEREDVRVLVPADWAYAFDYQSAVKRADVPLIGGRDISYATNSQHSADYFFRIRDGQRPWIAALDGAGRGLIQTSTAQQKGRKLFVWGMAPGSRLWQEFLSGSGQAYLEIQAGLGRTQAEYVDTQPGQEWSWLEAYGLAEAEPRIVHGGDWRAAGDAVNDFLERRLPPHELEREWRRTQPLAPRPPEEIIQRGAGWGALERRRRTRQKEPPFCGAELPFDDAALTERQEPWLELLERGALPAPDATPAAWMVQTEWHDLLATAVARGGDWHALLHLGVMHYYRRRYAEAGKCWRDSLAQRPNAWALRNLAVLARDGGRAGEAADLLGQAQALLPNLRPLAVE